MRRFFSLTGILLIVGLIAFFAGCSLDKYAADEGGDLVISIASQDLFTAKTIEPPLDMSVQSYDIYGNGPGGSSFQQLDVTPGTAVVQRRITPGTWVITVDAKNYDTPDPTAIGEGTTVVSVLSNKITEAKVTVYPIQGTGTLDLTVTWPDYDTISIIPDPQIKSSLTPSGGSASDITFLFNSYDTEATYVDDTLDNGYYKLSLKLYDGDPDTTGKQLWGTVEAARIIAGQISSKIYKLEGEINMGYLNLVIEKDLQNPIKISFTGNQDELPRGLDMTVVADTKDENGNPVTVDGYEWYLQGNLIAGETTDTITLGSNLAAGTYWLDLLVTKGSIYSSETVVFTVVDEIAFSSNRDGNYDIYKMDTAGVYINQLTLTDDPVENKYPAWSMDKTKIAFSSTRDGNAEIYTMNANGTVVTRLTTDAGSDISPAWSPDGSMIAFVSDRDGDNEIYVMNSADGSSLVQLTDNTYDEADPVWSPDGLKIAFTTNRDGYFQVYRMDPDGANPENITNGFVINDRNADYSSDGSKIAYVSDRDGSDDIYVKRSEPLGSYTKVTNNLLASDEYPAWAPWGDTLAFFSDRSDANNEIYTINADGSGLFRLTYNTFDDIHPDW